MLYNLIPYFRITKNDASYKIGNTSFDHLLISFDFYLTPAEKIFNHPLTPARNFSIAIRLIDRITHVGDRKKL